MIRRFSTVSVFDAFRRLSILVFLGIMSAHGQSPTLSSIVPDIVYVGASATTLVVNGSGFASTDTVRWNGSTSGVSASGITPTSMLVTLESSNMLATGSNQLEVVPAAGSPSNALPVQVFHATPVVSHVTPSSVTELSAPYRFRVIGRWFSGEPSWDGINTNNYPVSIINRQIIQNVACWGSNANLQIDTPSLPSSLTYTAISAGSRHSIARRTDGTISAWGDNQQGQCAVPTLPPTMTYVKIAAGYFHNIAARNDGVCVGWGDNSYGQCNAPTLPSGTTFAGLAAGGGHSVGRLSNGNAIAWGDNAAGQCSIPTLPSGLSYTNVSAGAAHTLLRRSDGSVIAVGDNSTGQCIVPLLPPGVTYTAISAGSSHSAALRSDGMIVVWGDNSFNQYSVPTLSFGFTYTAIVSGHQHLIAKRSDGMWVSWGRNTHGQCEVPAMPSGSNLSGIACGSEHSLGLSSTPFSTAWLDVFPDAVTTGIHMMGWSNPAPGGGVSQLPIVVTPIGETPIPIITGTSLSGTYDPIRCRPSNFPISDSVFGLNFMPNNGSSSVSVLVTGINGSTSLHSFQPSAWTSSPTYLSWQSDCVPAGTYEVRVVQYGPSGQAVSAPFPIQINHPATGITMGINSATTPSIVTTAGEYYDLMMWGGGGFHPNSDFKFDGVSVSRIVANCPSPSILTWPVPPIGADCSHTTVPWSFIDYLSPSCTECGLGGYYNTVSIVSIPAGLRTPGWHVLSGSTPYPVQSLGSVDIFVTNAWSKQLGVACGQPAPSLLLTPDPGSAAYDRPPYGVKLPRFGENVELRIEGAAPNANGILFYGAPGPATSFGGTCALQIGIGTITEMGPLAVNGIGEWTLSVQIPTIPALDGVSVCLQALLGSSTGLALTNGLELTFGF